MKEEPDGTLNLSTYAKFLGTLDPYLVVEWWTTDNNCTRNFGSNMMKEISYPSKDLLLLFFVNIRKYFTQYKTLIRSEAVNLESLIIL